MSPQRSLVSLCFAACLLMFGAACGGSSQDDGQVDLATGSSAQSDEPADESAGTPPEDGVVSDEPIPVEADGGIGDGAGPLPGAEDVVDEGTWHGAIVAETNCPGTTFQRVQANKFSFSVPSDFSEAEVQPVDSEVQQWSNGAGIDVSFDYGWYSGSVNGMPGSEVEAVDYSGFVGDFTVVRSNGDQNFVEVLFPELENNDGQWDRLSLLVRHDDPNDEIIGRCIVGSIEWEF